MERNKMTKVTRKAITFQEQYKEWWYLAAAGGLYPPGFEHLVKKPWVLMLAHLYSFLACCYGATYFLQFICLALFTNVYSSRELFMLYFRRCLAALQLSLKIWYNFSPIGYRRLNVIYETYNNVINNGFYVEKREKLMAERMRRSRGLFLFVLFFAVVLLQLPTLLLFTGRSAHGAGLAYFPHDPYVWYHFPVVTVQFFNFLIGGFSSYSFSVFSFITMLMANTQLEILRDSLRDIFHNGSENETGGNLERFVITENDVQRVRERLREWILVHQATNRWLLDIKKFFKFTSSLKFLFLGSYICLAVFTLPGYFKAGRITEIFFVFVYTIGNYCLLFFESRLADDLHKSSSMMFMGAYDTAWCAYPPDIRLSLLIIHNCSMQRPFRLKAFAIIYDNSATFLSIMETAYKMLSFLLQMDE